MPILVVFFVILTGAAWLVPNHYPPWLAAWSDAVAISSMLMLTLSIALLGNGNRRIGWQLPVVGVVCATVVLGQLAFGKLLFAGDGLMVVLYIGFWLMAVLTGGLMASDSRHREWLDLLMATWALVAIVSVGIALAQWTGAVNLYIYAADLPPGGRPFANVAQPNHFSTLCFLGLCGLLWLYQCGKIRDSVLWLGTVFLLFGMVASQSRTGWLQVGLLVAWGIVQRERSGLRVTRAHLLMLGAIFVVGVMLWQPLSDFLLLSAGRSLADQMMPGVRLPYWWSMLDAIGREPIFGYGWQQVGAAQQRVALDHQTMGSLFDHSHNFVLDILLWNGIPIGGVILVILAWWFIAHIRACQNSGVVWLLAAAAGVFAHAMVEFPLSYAYFLIPVGLAMGAIEKLSPVGGATLNFPRPAILVFTVIFGAVFSGVVMEYARTEERFRELRFELARIGTRPVETAPAKGQMLTQLEAFLKYYRTEAKPGMSPEELEWMRKVSERYGFSTVLLRYALAAGLNGQPEVAREALARVCRIHQARRCDEARESWVALQAKYPQLSGVMMPERQVSMAP